MITELNLKDGKLEYTIECDIEKGLVIAWHVIPVEPLPLQTVLNVPMLTRQASNAHCFGQQTAAQGHRQMPEEVRTSKRFRIGRDGTPIPV